MNHQCNDDWKGKAKLFGEKPVPGSLHRVIQFSQSVTISLMFHHSWRLRQAWPART